MPIWWLFLNLESNHCTGFYEHPLLLLINKTCWSLFHISFVLDPQGNLAVQRWYDTQHDTYERIEFPTKLIDEVTQCSFCCFWFWSILAIPVFPKQGVASPWQRFFGGYGLKSLGTTKLTYQKFIKCFRTRTDGSKHNYKLHCKGHGERLRFISINYPCFLQLFFFFK